MPIYNWFYYKEGFAAELVTKLADMLKIKKDSLVLDPFCGSGTTLLACKHLGLPAIGYDVLPISVFASYVKTRDYDIDKLETDSQWLLNQKFEKPKREEGPPIMFRAFSKYALDDIFFFKRKIIELPSEESKCFFLLALARAAIAVSYAWKDGAVIKIKKKHSPPLRFMLKRTIKRMISDLRKQESGSATIEVKQCDARKMNMQDDVVDVIITSPPYLNNIDYTKVYAIENFIISGLHIGKHPAVRSYIGLKAEYDELIDIDLPLQAKTYFTDMNTVIEEMFRVCKKSAKVAMVVGNGFVEGQIIDSDLLLAWMAEQCGFTVQKILVLNKRFALVNRTEKKGVLRESLIILEKK
jgi:DNA modification methylase